MLYSITTVFGGLVGAFIARRRGGNGFDIAQYAAVYAVLGFILGLLATILVARLA